MSEENLWLTFGGMAIWLREACELALTERMCLPT